MLFTALTLLGLVGLGLYLTRLRWAEHAALKAAAATMKESGDPASSLFPTGFGSRRA